MHISPRPHLNPNTPPETASKPSRGSFPKRGIPSHGAASADVMARLEAMRDGDIDYRSGRVYAYTYDAGRSADTLGKQAFSSFLTENALDPTVFPSLLRFENDVVSMVAAHLNGPPGTVGSFTSGGTESRTSGYFESTRTLETITQ